MKKALGIITVALALFAMAFTVSSCTGVYGVKEEIIYAYALKGPESPGTEISEEMEKILRTFKNNIGAASPFSMTGSSSSCDEKVKKSCEKALDSLKDKKWSADYSFELLNYTESRVIFTAEFKKSK